MAAREERYSIHLELGRGGMGAVFAAHDHVRRQPVALKRLLAEHFTTPAELERATTLFEHEFHTLSQLAHPHVVSAYDYGIDAHGPYYTMELLSGQSLRARSPMPWREAVALLRDVASALAIVHSRRLVHRDVTPLNVYCDAEGGAKLIDFGAMIPIGVAKQLVGTPAFIAPECLQSQPLDGQTDLFALGACLYFAISGRNAYPARDVHGLSEMWQRTPPPLSHYTPQVPEALETLVASLLSIQPAGRPRTAADVYEQLTSIADLPRSESAQIVRAYLSKPALVGRENQLGTLHNLLSRVLRGQGSSVSILGPAGIGRTRLLDAALLNAQLAGLRTARADASDSQDRPLGAIARLLQGLSDGGLEVGTMLARYELGPLLENDCRALLEARRQQTLRDLTSVIFELSERAPLAIAVDDLHVIDDPSLAVLASLALQVRRHRLLLITTFPSSAETRPSPGLRLLRDSSRSLQLQPLDEEQSRLLLSSVFGEAPNLDMLSALYHRRWQGNPRRLMESAEASITAGLVRYEGGGWVITPDATAIGSTLDQQTNIEQQLAGLSSDAVDLLEVMSFDRDGVTSLADYAALTEHADSARMHRALNELLSAGWLMMHSDRARFRRDDQRALLAAHVPAERARALHARLAERCFKPELSTIYPAYHLLRAGLLERACEPVETCYLHAEQHGEADILRNPILLETLTLICELPDPPSAHPAARANHAASVVNIGIYQGQPELAASMIEHALREIAPFSGLADYRELSHLPSPERLTQALTRANERCQQPGVYGLDLMRAIRRQTQLGLTTAVCARYMADESLLEGLPDLQPLVPLSPALALAAQVFDGLSKMARGQVWSAWDVLLTAYGGACGPQAEGIDSLTLVTLKLSMLGYLCWIEAEHASPKAPPHLAEFALVMPHSAASMQAIYYLAIGDLPAHAAARKQTELLSVQSHIMLETRNSEIVARSQVAALSDDLRELRRAVVELAEVAKTRPGWRFRLANARCHVLRCQGRLDDALALAERELAAAPALHIDFVYAAATRLELLLTAKRAEQARELAQDSLLRARIAGAPTFRIELALAQAHAELGDHELAEKAYATALSALESRQVRGILLGRAFETGALLALRRGDATCFAERAERCACHYAVHKNPGLGARHARLLRDAARAGVITSEPRPIAAPPRMTSELRELASIADESEFYAAALDYLVKHSGAGGGYLYTCTSEGLRRVAGMQSTHPADADALDGIAADCYARERRSRDVSSKPEAQLSCAVEDNLTAYPTALTRAHAGRRTIEGIVVFVANAPSNADIPRTELEQVATLMTLRLDSVTVAAPELASPTE